MLAIIVYALCLDHFVNGAFDLDQFMRQLRLSAILLSGTIIWVTGIFISAMWLHIIEKTLPAKLAFV